MPEYEAVGAHIFILKDEPKEEENGLLIPDQAVQKPNTGDIISKGIEIDDPRVQVGKKAIFNKGAGFTITFPDAKITILRKDQILGVVK